jgi:hypothetical protein
MVKPLSPTMSSATILFPTSATYCYNKKSEVSKGAIQNGQFRTIAAIKYFSLYSWRAGNLFLLSGIALCFHGFIDGLLSHVLDIQRR